MEWFKNLGMGLGCIISTALIGLSIFFFYNGMILLGLASLLANYWVGQAVDMVDK